MIWLRRPKGEMPSVWGLKLGKRSQNDPPERNNKAAMQFQEQLKRLQLEGLFGPPKRERPLEGLSVLDLRCGEGLLCREALRQGARRVVGIDQDEAQLRAARAGCPEATFLQGSCWDLPDEKFDVVFLLPLPHFDNEPDRLFARLRNRLAPGGKLVLECGHSGDVAVRLWKTLRHEGEVRKLPSLGLLYDVLLDGYAVRNIGSGVKQRGDPIQRSIFHCAPMTSTALLLSAPAGSGKTTLARQFLNVGWPDISTDRFLLKLLRDPDYAWRPIAQEIREMVGSGRPNWGKIGVTLSKKDDLVEEFCALVALEAPVESLYFYVEGAMLTHANVMECLTRHLKARGVRLWVVRPG